MGRILVGGVVGLALLSGCARGGAGAGRPVEAPAAATSTVARAGVSVDLEPVEALLDGVDRAMAGAEPGVEDDPVR